MGEPAENNEAQQEESGPVRVTWREFLESVPPYQVRAVIGMGERYGANCRPAKPDLRLHCDSKHCGDTRFFVCTSSPNWLSAEPQNFFLEYQCRNCGQSEKTYAVLINRNEDALDGEAIKYGELPAFGPPIPSRVISLIGPDRQLFLKGRRAEDQGLGIAAHAYYRRVVEDQYARLLSRIQRVAERIKAQPEVIEQLEAASNDRQFKRAIDRIKDGVPEQLLIDGHNPMVLLHRACSIGLHEKTDEECLELASSIRVVLTELADRIGQALKDQEELQDALTQLMQVSKDPDDAAN